jgi:hypothetical protein
MEQGLKVKGLVPAEEWAPAEGVKDKAAARVKVVVKVKAADAVRAVNNKQIEI